MIYIVYTYHMNYLKLNNQIQYNFYFLKIQFSFIFICIHNINFLIYYFYNIIIKCKFILAILCI